MIDHTGLSVSDFDTAKAFYDKALEPLGAGLKAMIPVEFTGGCKVGGFGPDRPVFWLSEGGAQVPPVHIAFSAASRRG